MKFVFLIFLFGLAAASFEETLHKSQNEILQSFKEGLKKGPSLRSALNLPYSEELDEFEAYADDKIADELKDHLDRIIEKIKDAVEKGKDIKHEFLEMFKELKEKLKEKGSEFREKGKEILEKLKQAYKELLGKFSHKLDEHKRSVDDAYELASTEFGLRDMLRDLRDKLVEKMKEHIDIEKIKQLIKEKFKEHKEAAKVLLQELAEHGKKALKEFLDELIGNKETRSLKELWEKMKEFLKKVGLDFKEKYLALFEWLKEKVSTGLENAKDKLSKLKLITKEFIEHHKQVSKEVAIEILDYMKPYKEDLGELWDQLKDAVKDVLSRDS